MKPRVKGMLLMTACIMLWSFTGLLAKAIPWNGVALSGWRALISAVMLYAYMRGCGIKPLWDGRSLLIGVCVAGAAVFCLVANKLTAAANVIMLQYTAPVFLIIYTAIFAKRRYAFFDYAVVAVTIGGILMFFLDELTPGGLWGNIFSLLLGATYGGMFFLCEGITLQSRLSGILWGFLMTALVGMPFLFFTQNSITPASVGLVVLMGVVFYGLPYIFYALSLRDCPALAAVLISALEIILNPVWVYLFLREKPGKWALIGSAVILGAVLFYSVRNARREQSETKEAQHEG